MSLRKNAKRTRRDQSTAKREQLRRDYYELRPRIEGLTQEIVRQLQVILEDKVSLAVPVQFRVKSLESISEKVRRKSLKVRDLRELKDFAGLRIIVAFLRDLSVVCDLIEDEFDVIDKDVSPVELGDDKFGYASIHYILRLKQKWLSFPTLKRCDDLRFELQVRTVAQHMWASASHVLQYKQEANVPAALRRSMNRVAAFLEAANVEFERVLLERAKYRAATFASGDMEDTLLNVDLLESVMDAELPTANANGQ